MINGVSAIDNGIAELLNGEQTVEDSQVEVNEPTTEEVVVDNDEPVEGEEVVEQPTDDKVHIEGLGDFTIDELKEFRNGYLRQSDYTRKTQELARQREEAQDALELYNYLRENPQMVNALMQMDNGANQQVIQRATPEASMMQQIIHTQKAMEIEMKLNELKGKYGNDIDEVALFQKANQLKTNDLEFVYKALQYDNLLAERQQAEQNAANSLQAEIAANKKAVSTIVSPKQGNVVKQSPSLSADEKRVAALMGLSEADYLKWKV